MRVLHASVLLSTVVALGCASGPRPLAPEAWWPSRDPSASRRPVDCSDLTGAEGTSVGDPVEPGRGNALQQPSDLGAGAVRLVWSSSVAGVLLDWVAPVGVDARTLWLLRVADSGRCVVGTWASPQLGMEVVKHAFVQDGRLEVVLLGLGPPAGRGWMVLVTDGSRLWSGLDSRDGRPGAIIAEEAELQMEGAQLLLVVTDRGRTGVRTFDGIHFATRP